MCSASPAQLLRQAQRQWNTIKIHSIINWFKFNKKSMCSEQDRSIFQIIIRRGIDMRIRFYISINYYFDNNEIKCIIKNIFRACDIVNNFDFKWNRNKSNQVNWNFRLFPYKKETMQSLLPLPNRERPSRFHQSQQVILFVQWSEKWKSVAY